MADEIDQLLNNSGRKVLWVSLGGTPERFALAVVPQGGAGATTVEGADADGDPASGNPVLVAGADDSGDVQTLKVNADGELVVNLETADIQIGAVEIKDASTDARLNIVDGAALVQGLVPDGGAVAGRPVLMGGQDGTNVQSLLTDSGGRLQAQATGPVADGAAVAGVNPVVIGGSDGTNAQTLLTDANGNQRITGAVGDGAAVAGADPVLIAGQDGTNVQSILTDSTGRPVITGAAAGGAAAAGNPVLTGAADNGGTARIVRSDAFGALLESSGALSDGAGAVTVKYANGIATASGDNVVLAAVASKKIRVLSYNIQCQEAGTIVTAQFQDNGTATGRGMRWKLFMAADGSSIQGAVVPYNPHGHFETASGVGLDLNLDGAIDVAYSITYVEVA